MLGRQSNVSGSGLFMQLEGALPALEADESASFTVIASPSDKLTLETMFVQSNDWFYGLALFNDDGLPVSGDNADELTLYDTGIEADTAPDTEPETGAGRQRGRSGPRQKTNQPGWQPNAIRRSTSRSTVR